MKIVPATKLTAPVVSAAGIWRITRWLLAAVAVLLALHIVRLNTPREMSIMTLRMVIDEFHFDREGNVPTWFSSTLMTVAAALMIGIGVRARQTGGGLARRWIAMGVIFVLLSIDESASFHEMLIHPLRNRLNVANIGFLHFTWVVPALFLLAVLAVTYLSFLIALPARTRWSLIAAAAVYVLGAVGMEMFGGVLASEDRRDSTAFAVTITIEETAGVARAGAAAAHADDARVRPPGGAGCADHAGAGVGDAVGADHVSDGVEMCDDADMPQTCPLKRRRSCGGAGYFARRRLFIPMKIDSRALVPSPGTPGEG